MSYCKIHDGFEYNPKYGCPLCAEADERARDAEDRAEEARAEILERLSSIGQGPDYGEFTCPHCRYQTLRRDATRCPACRGTVSGDYWAQVAKLEHERAETRRVAEASRRTAEESARAEHEKQRPQREREARARKAMARFTGTTIGTPTGAVVGGCLAYPLVTAFAIVVGLPGLAFGARWAKAFYQWYDGPGDPTNCIVWCGVAIGAVVGAIVGFRRK